MSLSAEGSYLFLRSIAEEEDLNGFLHQLATARAIPDPMITKSLWGMKSDTRVWFLPRNVKAAVEAFWMSLPSLQQTLDNHTRTRLDLAFKDEEDGRRLTDAYVDYGRLVPYVSRIKGRLKVCAECVEEDRRKYGYAYWHRLALIPGVDVCPEHAMVYRTLCGGCETKNFHTRRLPWQPEHRCACGGRLRAVRKMSARHMSAELKIAKMTQQLLSGEFRPSPGAPTLRKILRDFCSWIGQGLEPPDLTLNGMLLDRLGPEYLAKFSDDRNQPPVVDESKGPGPFFEPLQNICAIYAAFGSWSRYSEVSAKAQATLRKHDSNLAVVNKGLATAEPVVQLATSRTTKWPNNPTRADFRERFLALSEEEFIARKEEARRWLRNLLENNPSITRRTINNSKKYNRHFVFLKLFDEEYYLASVRNVSTLSDEVLEVRLRHIYHRREFMLKEFPWIRITKKILVESIPTGTSRRLGGKRITDALDACKDTTLSYHERLVPILSRWIRSIYPDSYYGDESVYRPSEGKQCAVRISTAKNLLNSGRLATAHPCHFLGRRETD